MLDLDPHQIERRNLVPLLLALLLPAAAVLIRADAGPGDVFREYTYANRFHELDPGATNPGSASLRVGSGEEKNLDIFGLGSAVRAELSVEYWGGHSGTSDQKFRVNGNDWIQIPQPKNTPTPPQCYYRTVLGRATVPLPLEHLKRGHNVFQFAAVRQICHSFNWGFFWVYAFTVRVYYKPSSPETTGEITTPADDARIGDFPRLTAKAASTHHTISRVDYIAHYEDFNWEGDGVYRQWHYQTERGALRHHVGTATAPPYAVTWDTSWVPDQDQPVRIVAWITNNDGVTYVTPEVKVTLSRLGRSVKMYKPYDVPEVFGVRVKQRKTCKIDVADDPAKAAAARLFLSTWSAAHAEEIGLNGRVLVKSIGAIHNYSYDAIPVPLDAIRKGVNTFHIYSGTQEHAAEVNWPGPVLMLEFREPLDVAQGSPKAAWRRGTTPDRCPDRQVNK